MILIYFIIGSILSVTLNLTVIIVLTCQKRRLIVVHYSFVSLSISDLLQAGIGYSMEIFSYFNRSSQSRDGDSACTIGAFSVSCAVLFSLPSLIGWSEYRRLRPDDLACQLDMVDTTRENNSTSYLWSLFIGCCLRYSHLFVRLLCYEK